MHERIYYPLRHVTNYTDKMFENHFKRDDHINFVYLILASFLQKSKSTGDPDHPGFVFRRVCLLFFYLADS
jgi:hypothetical protein